MEKEFVLYNEALALRDSGFNEPCFGYFSLTFHEYPIDKHGVCTRVEIGDFISEEQFKYIECLYGDKFKTCKAPLYQQIFRWFREKYNLRSVLIPFWIGKTCMVVIEGKSSMDYETRIIQYNTYKEAELACLKKLIEIIKKEHEERL